MSKNVVFVVFVVFVDNNHNEQGKDDEEEEDDDEEEEEVVIICFPFLDFLFPLFCCCLLVFFGIFCFSPNVSIYILFLFLEEAMERGNEGNDTQYENIGVYIYMCVCVIGMTTEQASIQERTGGGGGGACFLVVCLSWYFSNTHTHKHTHD